MSEIGDEATTGQIKKMSQLHVLDGKGTGPGEQRQGQGLASEKAERHWPLICEL